MTYKVFGETISTSDIRRTTNRTSFKFWLTFSANQMTIAAGENRTSSWHLSANRTLQLFAQLIDCFFPELFLRIFIRFVVHFFVPCSSIRCLKLVPLDVDRSALPDSEPKQLREDHPSSHSFLALMLSIEIYKAKFLIFLTNSSNGYFKPLSKMKTRICNFINS